MMANRTAISVLLVAVVVATVFSAAHCSAQEESQKKYSFSTDWVSPYVGIWAEVLAPFKGKPAVKALEIGSWEGRSALWFLENIQTHETSTITCIDIFNRKDVENRFDDNMETSGVGYKVKKLKGRSQDVLRGLETGTYDFVYIDGSHIAVDVLVDAVLSWDLMKNPGGVIIFDNYLWKMDFHAARRPKIAIDAFLDVMGSYIDVLHQATPGPEAQGEALDYTQVIVRRNGNPHPPKFPAKQEQEKARPQESPQDRQGAAADSHES